MIRTKSPTRVDLAGGTLDCWPLYLFVGDCKTVNIAIDITTGCELEILSEAKIDLNVSDLNWKKSYQNLDQLISASEPEVLLVQKIFEYYRPAFGIRLKTFSQSPVGAGLGGSSSLCITLIKAFNMALKIEMNKYQMVELAHNLEAKVLNKPTGTQDYFPAINGGLSIINYTAAGMQVESIHGPIDKLWENILLVYTGKAHHSGINNWEVIKSVIDGDKSILSALKEIACIADDTAKACQEQSWQKLPDLFRAEFDARVKLTSYFSSPEIENLKKISINSGAQAVKICGAGGGGCVLLWAPPDAHERIVKDCQKNNFIVLKSQPQINC